MDRTYPRGWPIRFLHVAGLRERRIRLVRRCRGHLPARSGSTHAYANSYHNNYTSFNSNSYCDVYLNSYTCFKSNSYSDCNCNRDGNSDSYAQRQSDGYTEATPPPNS